MFNTAYLHCSTIRYVAYIAREILNGLAYLHDRKMAHRDVKSSNVMISIDGQIKLSTPLAPLQIASLSTYFSDFSHPKSPLLLV